jgi:diaminopimelate decarboxylase
VSIADIVRDVDSPVYVYSGAAIRNAYAALDSALSGARHTLHYALKANSSLAILRLLRSIGARADANSGGEIEVARRAGFDPAEIVFTGVGKTRDELDRAVALGVKAINIESDGEAGRIDDLARTRGVKARVALRVNPDINPNTHAHISTGQRFNKFGVPIEHAAHLLREMGRRSGLDVVGLHVHLGSQIVEMEPIARAAQALAALALEARDIGLTLRHLDLGGGLGIAYDGATPTPLAEYAAAIAPFVAATGLDLLIEPGRYVVGPAGILVGRIADLKIFAGSPRFMVLDAGMTELLRPALYGAYHRIMAVAPRAGDQHAYEVVGPLCETSDTLGHERRFGPVEVGDPIAIFDAGAYGMVMASNYNRRRLPAEVLVDEGTWQIIRRRQSYDDLMAWET